MIEVLFSPPCRKVMELLEISSKEVTTTINEHHRGIICGDENRDTRIIAAHWFNDDNFILADSIITDLKQVTAQIALKLPFNLPSGKVSRDMKMDEILRVVAESFGHPVTCHPDSPPDALYSGAWDGKWINEKLKKLGNDIYTCGTFYPKTRTCEFVWALDFNKYRHFLNLN
jgi:hypothetical protein